MALKKNFFKGLQGGINHSPLKMHEGKPHSKKDFKGLLAHKLATKEPVVDERLLNQNVSDNLAVEKFRQNNDVSSEQIIKDAAKIKKTEEKKIQENQNKNRATIGQGAVTEQEKEQAAINNERGEKIHNASLGLLERPLAYMSDPSAVLGDMGINSFLGFDTGNTTQLAREIETMRTDPNLSFSDKLKAKTQMGLGMVPSATLNVGLGMIGAGGVGTGVKGAANYTGRVLNNAVNPLAGLGKPTAKAVSNALGNNIDDAGVDAVQQAINAQKGTTNVNYNLDNIDSVGDFSFDIDNLPERFSSDNSFTDFINQKFLGSDKELGKSLEPLARELRKGANTFRETREFAANNMRSEQGQQRLTDLITETLDSKTEIPFSFNAFKDKEIVANMSPKTREKYINYFKNQHQDKLTNSKSMNELVDELAFDSQGNYNPNGAVKAIYGDGKRKRHSLVDNAFYSGIKKNQDPTYALGANLTGSSPTAYHELLGHGGQQVDNLGIIGADNRLRNLSQRSAANSTPDQGYFNTGSGGKEPYAFAQELKKSMYDSGILKNNNGTWETVTPGMLEEARDIFNKSPKGNLVGPQDGRFFNEARALDFVEDLEGLSTEMNKLIGANNPGDADGKNKFDLLKVNSMEANA
tara:strand:- start:472 stop:2382 length:1911 start_codon:yes stop_codon:yes gene_type:complete